MIEVTRQTHRDKRMGKLSLELNMLISILKDKTLQIGDGLKSAYFKRIDKIKEEMKTLGF